MLKELISDKNKCCGCTSCANACPKQCIEMQSDFEGFLYPMIDTDKCVNCGLCHKVCPIENPVSINDTERKSFVVRSKNIDTVMKSTSGGFFTPLATWVLENNGVICAAAFDKDFSVIHTFLYPENIKKDTIDDKLGEFRGSKYVQSNLSDCYGKIKKLLSRDKLVCFVGTPCQVSGLKKFLRSDYEKLLTVDLVCHGTPSPKLWRKYLDYQSEKYSSEIKNVSFRNKTYGYHSGTMKIEFENGRKYYGSARVDYMLKSFFAEISSRPVCYKCHFKTVQRCSDFTIYDCWDVSRLTSGVKDDDRGYTNLIVQSENGMKVLENIKNAFEIYPVDTETAVKLDGIMVRNAAIPHKMRENYYKAIDEESLQAHVQKFIPISKKDYLIESLKLVVYKLGLLKIMKRILK